MNTIKYMYLFLSEFFAVQQSDDFVLLTALQPAVIHLPGPSEFVDTLTDLTSNQQRTKSWNKLSTCKRIIRLIYSYNQANSSRFNSSCLPIRTHIHCQEFECKFNIQL